MVLFFDRDNQPLELMDWAMKFEEEEYRKVALDVVDGVVISTIWVGFDGHDDVDPQIFETMLFTEAMIPYGDRWMYATEMQALTAHAKLVKDVRNHLLPAHR